MLIKKYNIYFFRYKTPGEESSAATWPADQGNGRIDLADGHLQWAGQEEGGHEMESSVYKRIQEESVKSLNDGHSNGK